MTMLTVDFDRFRVSPGEHVLDMGCGAGRHAFELYRRGAHVVAFDRDEKELAEVAKMFAAMELESEAPEGASARTVTGDALSLPFPDDTFDKIVAAEVLEHIPDDMAAMAELLRVLKPGGELAATVPSWLP
jgi:ubiquinone/menaquinone biosynthesis C-methylase UbiE